MDNNHSLQARFYNQLEQAPTRRAITFYQADGNYTWLTFEQLYRKAARTAAQLSHHGLEQGDVCVIVLPSNEFAVTTVLATLLQGAVPVLVAPPVVQGSMLDLPKIIKHTVRKTEARLVICDESMSDRRNELEDAPAGARYVFGNGELQVNTGGGADIPRVVPAVTDVAALQLTSGTTGFPRVCVWSQEGVLAALDGMASAMQLSEADCCFNWTPLYHDMGLVNNFLLCLTQGIPLALFSPHEFVKRPGLWLRGLSDTGATITWSPNFGYAITAERTRDRQLEGVRLDHVRAFWNAAERIHFNTIQSFYDRFKPYGLTYEALNTNFGCAENVGGATFSEVDEPIVVEHVNHEQLFEERVAQPVSGQSNGQDTVPIVSAGRPHPDLDIQILSDTGESLPEGQVGEIALDTPSRMMEYLEDPEATQGSLDENLLRTGDLGYLRDDNLFWVGRLQERITVRGKKLDPSDFEPVLFGIEGLRKGCFVVFGVDDQAKGTQKIVVVSEVRQPLTRSLDEILDDIRQQTFLRLGVTIDEVELVEAGTLAKTSSGKRRHRHFRECYLKGELQPFYVKEISDPTVTH